MYILRVYPEQAYLVFYDKEPKLCECGENYVPFLNFNNGYKNYCSTKCPAVKSKRIQGTHNRTPEQHQEMLRKMEATKLERYGDENYKNHDKSKETWSQKSDEEIQSHVTKVRQTKLERYGDENYNNMSQIVKTSYENNSYTKGRETFRSSLTEEEYAEHYRKITVKVKATKLKRYGDEKYNNIEKGARTRRKNNEYYYDDWKMYRTLVRNLTRKTYLRYEDIINPNNLDRTLCGIDGHQLDHILSVKFGFEHNILPYIIAPVENLQMIHWKENRTKGCGSTTTLLDYPQYI